MSEMPKPFDKLAAYRTFKAAEFSEPQASALADAFAGAHLDGAATKADVATLGAQSESRFNALAAQIETRAAQADLLALSARMDARFQSLDQRMDARFEATDAKQQLTEKTIIAAMAQLEMRMTRMIGTSALAGLAAVVAIIRYVK